MPRNADTIIEHCHAGRLGWTTTPTGRELGGLADSELLAVMQVAPVSQREDVPRRTGVHCQRRAEVDADRRLPVETFAATRGFPGVLSQYEMELAQCRCQFSLSVRRLFCCVGSGRLSDRRCLERGEQGWLVLFHYPLSPHQTSPQSGHFENAESTCGGEWTHVLQRNQGGTGRAGVLAG